MSQSYEHAGLKILAKIKIYILSRANLLYTVWDETPCSSKNQSIFIISRHLFEIFVCLRNNSLHTWYQSLHYSCNHTWVFAFHYPRHHTFHWTFFTLKRETIIKFQISRVRSEKTRKIRVESGYEYFRVFSHSNF